MRYMGGKTRLSKNIIPFILSKRKSDNQYYVEPFCGGCNVIDKVKGKRIAGDNNKYLIALLKGIAAGRAGVKDIDKALYDRARIEYRNNTNIEFDDFEIGWIGFVASFNGRFFDGGFAKKYPNKNFHLTAINNLISQRIFLQGIEFYCSDYRNLEIPSNSIIYCDPPYFKRKEYSSSTDFDYENFWDWCRLKKEEGHEIFISETYAPNDFLCIWEKEIVGTINPTKSSERVERLFTL